MTVGNWFSEVFIYDAVFVLLLFLQVLIALIVGKVKKNGYHQKLLVVKDATDSYNAPYLVTVVTGSRPGAGTAGVVQLTLTGTCGGRADFLINPALYDLDKQYFRRAASDIFLFTTANCLEELLTVEVQLAPAQHPAPADPTLNESWYLSYILVENISTGDITYFPCHEWIKCHEGKVVKDVLLAGHSQSFSATVNFGLDMFCRSLWRHHCWSPAHDAGNINSVFNLALYSIYRTCLLASLLLSTALVYVHAPANRPITLAYCFIPALLITGKLWALERALYYYLHRSRFDKWMLRGHLAQETLVTATNDEVTRAITDLSESIWEPYCAGDSAMNDSRNLSRGDEPMPTDSADWSPIISQSPPTKQQLLSDWMTSTPGSYANPPQQVVNIAQASDSDYRLSAHDIHISHEDIGKSPRDNIPLRLFDSGPNYQSTNTNKDNSEPKMNIKSTDSSTDIILEPVMQKEASRSSSKCSDEESILRACYVNEAFDPNYTPEKNELSEQLPNCADINIESWVVVEKPMEMILLEAIKPALSSVVEPTGPETTSTIIPENETNYTKIDPPGTDQYQTNMNICFIGQDQSGTIERSKNNLDMKSESVRECLNPLVDELLSIVREALISGHTTKHNRQLDVIKAKLSKVLGGLVQATSRNSSKQRVVNHKWQSNGGSSLNATCHSDSVLQKSNNEPFFSSHNSSKSQSALHSTSRKQSRPSIEDIQTSLALGPVAAKISSLLIDYSLSSHQLENRLATKSQQKREEMLNTLRSKVIGESASNSQSKRQESSTAEYQDYGPVVANPLEVMGRIPAKFTGKINSHTMLQIASASLQSILSDETRARFDEIVASQCENEARAFAEHVVNSLYEIVREKMQSYLDTPRKDEYEQCGINQSSQMKESSQEENIAEGAVGGEIEDKGILKKRQEDMEQLLAAAQWDIRKHVLPLVSDYVMKMLANQAKALDTLDVDLMMLLYGGQYVDTIVTNAVLQTHVDLVHKSKRIIDATSQAHKSDASTPDKSKENTNASNSLGPDCSCSSDENNNNSTSFILTAFLNKMKGKKPRLKPPPQKMEEISISVSDEKLLIDSESILVESYDSEKSDESTKPNLKDHAYCIMETQCENCTNNNNEQGNETTPANKTPQKYPPSLNDVTLYLPALDDVESVTSQVLEAVHARLKEAGTAELSGLMGEEGKIHCGLCKPKAIRQLKRKVAAMAAGRHLTLQVYHAALSEIQKLAGLESSNDVIRNTSNLLETDLLKRVGQILLKESDEGEGCGAALGVMDGQYSTASTKLHCQETIERVAEEIMKEVMQRAHGRTAENLIDMLRHGGEEATDTTTQPLCTSLNYSTLGGESSGALDFTEPLSQLDPHQLSNEYEMIRIMLFEPDSTKENRRVHFDLGDHDVGPTCKYFRHTYEPSHKYRLAHNQSLFHVLLCILIALATGSVAACAIYGLAMTSELAHQCVLSFWIILIFHAFVLELIKVILLTINAVVIHNQLP